MPTITISTSAEEEGILFPIVGEAFTLSDLRTAFPKATSLRYKDDTVQLFQHVLCRESTFIKPDGGWFKENRQYIVVQDTVAESANAKFETFEQYRKQLASSSSGFSNSRRRTVETSSVNVTVGHGHFEKRTFKKYCGSSPVGGTVSVGPFTSDTDTRLDIKIKAVEKFCDVNRAFKEKFKHRKFVLLYKDGSEVERELPNGEKFSLKTYRDFLNPQMRFDRMRFYLCERDNFLLNTTSIEIDSDSDFELMDPKLDDTVPLVINITFLVATEEVIASFPNNTSVIGLKTFLKDHSNLPNIQLIYNDRIINDDEKLQDLSVENNDNEITITVRIIESTNEISKPIASHFHDESTPDAILRVALKELEGVQEPTTILKTYSRHFLMGRQLDITDESQESLGNTSEVFVGRSSLFKDALSEMIQLDNIRYPIKVGFYNEEVEDLGGPRRELFANLMREIQQMMINEDTKEIVKKSNYIAEKYYYAAGLAIGLSVLEGGECPKYLNIMLAEKEAEEYQQFRRGLSKTGILQLLKEKPTLGYLFQQNSGRLTVGKLIHILKPEFAEAGTNKRTAEERLYSSFVKYIRKSAAGQRGQVTLEKILQFSTGSPEEPVLEFSIAPRVNFAAINGDFPTASTCINQLTLPVTLKNEDELFEKFDMAFMNNYFGLR